MEGILHVPPDRGTIIGRAIWKPRFVVVAAPAEAKQRLQELRRQQLQQLQHPSAASAQPPPPLQLLQHPQLLHPEGPAASAAAAATPSKSAAAGHGLPPRAATPRSPASLAPETMYLTIFKSKGEWDPIQQHAISSITDCQVQMVSHRKQGPVLPTLVLSLSPDPVTDKLRKRRSSRTAGLTTTKETAPTTLWFRPAEDSSHPKHILQEWCRFIHALMLQLGTATPASAAAAASASAGAAGTPHGQGSRAGPLSPITPASPTFSNPFAVAHGQHSALAGHAHGGQGHGHGHGHGHAHHGHGHRPGSDHMVSTAASRMHGLSRKASSQTNQTSQTNHTHSSRERDRDRDRDHPKTYSESPSLRSRRSDLSHTSSNLPLHVSTANGAAAAANAAHAGHGGGGCGGGSSFALPFFQNRPADLPSPATTVAEFQADLGDGWTPSAHGRSSTVSSPARGRDSISIRSQPPPPPPPPPPAGSSSAATGSALPGAAASTSSPPAPRETILDRAFQLRFIPGSDRDLPGEEKLSSLARFDALMREAEERKRLRRAVAASDMRPSASRAGVGAAAADTQQPKSGWDFDDDDDDDDDDDEEEEGEEEDEEDEDGYDGAGVHDASDDSDSWNRHGEEDDAFDDDTDAAMYSGDERFPGRAAARRRDGRRADSSGLLDPAIEMEIAPNARRALDFIVAGRQRDAERAQQQQQQQQQQQHQQEQQQRRQQQRASSAPKRPQPPSASPSAHVLEASSSTPKARAGGGLVGYDVRTLRTLDGTGSSSSSKKKEEDQAERPHTGYGRSRPAIAQRTHSQPQLAALNVANLVTVHGHRHSKHGRSPVSPVLPPSPPPLPRAATSSTVDTMSSHGGGGHIKRQSSSSIKRLSFTDFTKRLSSSTSSLLLVQTNASSGNASGSISGSESIIHEGVVGADGAHAPPPPHHHHHHHHHHSASTRLTTSPPGPAQPPMAVPPPPPPPAAAEHCGWRGSMGVINTEGGFL